MIDVNNPPYDCPACGAKPGKLHKLGCDQEKCRGCGGQLIFRCGGGCSRKEQRPRVPWPGEFHGWAECREFGYWAKMGDDWEATREAPAYIGEDGVYPGLNTLWVGVARGILRWDRDKARFVKVEPDA